MYAEVLVLQILAIKGGTVHLRSNNLSQASIQTEGVLVGQQQPIDAGLTSHSLLSWHHHMMHTSATYHANIHVLFTIAGESMRSIFTPLLAVPAILLHSVVLAETSVSVPAFALDISSYSSFSEFPVSVEVPTASISLLSTSQTSTVISLDSFEGGLDVRSAGGGHMLATVYATMTLQAAAGYQITGIEFSASTYAIPRPPTVPSNAINIDYGGFSTHAWSSAVISDVGASEPPPELYYVENFTTPIPVGWNLSNPNGLSNFDLTMEVWGSVRSGATFFEMPGDELGIRYKTYGTTELYYVDPLLTVYTAALPVPEPGTWIMMGAGLLLIGASRRRYVAQAKELSHQPGK